MHIYFYFFITRFRKTAEILSVFKTITIKKKMQYLHIDNIFSE